MRPHPSRRGSGSRGLTGRWRSSRSTLALPAEEYKALVRSTDSAILGIVGKGFRPLQNVEAFRFFNPWLESGAAALQSAGALRGGRRVWVLAKVKGLEGDVGPGDPVAWGP